tara:strand:+ start:1001 stop:1297 length:297 start_codon:yes stop_codon:yes gene_type:complete
MAGYKLKNGSKNYTIKSYRDGGLVETKSYKDGKIVVAMAPVTEDSIPRMKAKDFVSKYGGDEARIIIDSLKQDSKTTNLERELKNREKNRIKVPFEKK